MPHSFRSFKLLIGVAGLALASLACNIDFIGDIVEQIDTTPTDCNTEVFVVTATNDTHDTMCNTHCTLRDAVFAANACPGEDVIQLGAGTFSLSLRGAGNERGDLDITESVTITGISPEETIITAAESWTERIVEVGAGTTVRISGLTISNGNTETEAGGGVLNFGSLTLENVSLRQNIAYSGGALYNAGVATLQNVGISDNFTLVEFNVGRGGNILPFPEGGSPDGCGGGIANAGNMQISGASVTGNSSVIGAGICNLNGGVMNVAGSQVSENGSRLRVPALGGGFANFGALSVGASQINGNFASYGGGLYVLMPSGTALDLQQVTLENNEALDASYSGDGGGLYVKSGAFTIDNSLILANRANNNGGGIHLEPGTGSGPSHLGETYGNVDGLITNTTVANNRAAKGDGIGKGGGISSNGFYGFGDYHFENVTISGNQAYERGGAINMNWRGDFTFVNVTIAHNWGRTTSGINVESSDYPSLDFKNTLIAENSPWNCYFGDARPRIISRGYNIEVGNLCGLRESTDSQIPSGTMLFFPDLVEDNGQLVHTLIPGGRAVDKIPPAECPTQDQRGTSRPQGERCDVGAYELAMTASSLEGFSAPVVPEATPTPTALPTPTAVPQIPSITFTKNAFCRKGPGTAYFDLTAFEAGKTTDIVGKNEQGNWWLVQVPGGQQRCWVADSVGDKTGDLSLVPVEPTPVLPDAPSGFNDSSACNPNLKTRDVKLAWVDSPNETGYRLYRNGVLLTSPGANVTVYVDNVASDKGFTYEIEAINAFGASARQTTEASACN